MPEPLLHILILEDNPYDLQIMQHELRRGGLNCAVVHADSRAKFEAELKQDSTDIILADYRLPKFNGMAALEIARQVHPDVPFIIVSGEIGEDLAVDIVKEGATDYVLKDKMARLVPSVRRALQEAENRRERRRAEEQLRKSYQELERRVEERTKELSETNRALKEEIVQRQRLEEALRDLPNRIMEAQETERKKIAYELHDTVNQVLASVKFRIQLLEKSIINRTYKKGDLDELLGLIGMVIQELRRISHDLRPSALDDLGLLSVLSNYCKEFEEQTGITVVFTCAKQAARLPRDIETALYRTIQEALVNIDKHASASSVELKIAQDRKRIVVVIRDNGKGFDYAKSLAHTEHHGIGLVAMRERITSVGGTIGIDSSPDHGTVITIEIPLT